jgi:hypothetical protein
MKTPKQWLLGLCLLALPASAQMAEKLKSEFHKQEELGVVIVKPEESAMLASSMADPKTRVIILQLTEGQLDPVSGSRLVDWVRAGHGLWIYDARLAGKFGFQPLLMKKNQFTNKPEKGELGGNMYQGVATTALAMSSHVVTTGVGQVTAFLPRLGEEEEYGAVEVKGDTVGLLRYTISSPAIAALRREGRGVIVFKPLLWNEALSGDRFQSNLLEYSAGFQVPGMAGAGRLGSPPGPEAEYVTGSPAVPLPTVSATDMPALTASPTPPPVPTPKETPVAAPAVVGQDQIDVVGEGTLQGTVVNPSLRFETTSKSLQLLRAEVDRVELSQGGQLDVVFWRDGRQSKGLLVEKNVEIEVTGGDTRKIEKKLLKVIRWGKPS